MSYEVRRKYSGEFVKSFLTYEQAYQWIKENRFNIGDNVDIYEYTPTGIKKVYSAWK